MCKFLGNHLTVVAASTAPAVPPAKREMRGEVLCFVFFTVVSKAVNWQFERYIPSLLVLLHLLVGRRRGSELGSWLR